MARSFRQETETPRPRLILDSRAVVSLSRGENLPLALSRRALELDLEIRIPVAVLAETLLGGTGGKNTVDALVAAEAVASQADVLTGDPVDLRRLLGGLRARSITTASGSTRTGYWDRAGASTRNARETRGQHKAASKRRYLN